MNVNGPFNIIKSSSIDLGDNITLDNAEIKYHVELLNGISVPIFKGNTDAHSKTISFSFHGIDRSIDMAVSNITIYSGRFECDDWIKALGKIYSGGFYKDPICQSVSSQSASILESDDEEEKELILQGITHNTKPPPEKKIKCRCN